jgi:aspartyl-tRNA(Asn)/glutamyl-tRNA(Gln) amidotransferase subunit B
MFEAVVGLEVHAQLATRAKLFCGCSTTFGAPPNTLVCPVCLGLPGALPVVNDGAVELALRAALALGCRVQETSVWARKNYFYPDLCKGYQISQYEHPYALGGSIESATAAVPLTRIHMEEDAGKTVHGPVSAVDYNRAGTPLIEIVTEPALHSAADAAEILRSLRRTLRAIGACDGNMEQGSLRCDANVSIRQRGERRLNTRVELKNINSFQFVADAIRHEVQRQIDWVAAGGVVAQETRLWDPDRGESRPMRSKEDAHDYRYFPDPDLMPLHLPSARVSAVSLPELPLPRARRYQGLGVPWDAAMLLAEHAADFFEAALATSTPRGAAQWLVNSLGLEGVGTLPFTGGDFGALVQLVESGSISGSAAKRVLQRMRETGEAPARVVDALGLRQVQDQGQLEAWAQEVLHENSAQVEAYRAGKTKLLGYFVGKVMAASGGQADPVRVTEILRRRLS